MRPTLLVASLIGSALAASEVRAIASLFVHSPARILSHTRLAPRRPQGSKHYHTGKLSKYEIGPPALLLSSADEQRLRSGRAVMQTITSEDGTSRRMVMVQDINAPSQVVLG